MKVGGAGDFYPVLTAVFTEFWLLGFISPLCYEYAATAVTAFNLITQKVFRFCPESLQIDNFFLVSKGDGTMYSAIYCFMIDLKNISSVWD